jgi:hypothetical protein|uniref:Intron-binding protein aquarius N-terminus n=1 Tax=Caudovirales sp. ctSxd6 TaxID=2826774 RepID=A0A8S5NET0_9CAUD|nr:MAG TPA: Intron-binding protein aquarius N-terminus [Caudovirales sp. ctSxd6]
MATVIIQGSNGAQGALQVDSEGYLLVNIAGSGGGGGGSPGGGGGHTITVQVPVPDPTTVEENKRLKAKVAELEERIKKL